MSNFAVINNFTEEEMHFLANLFVSTVFDSTIPLKKQFIILTEDAVNLEGADKMLNVNKSEILSKIEALDYEELVELAKYIEFFFYSKHLPLNIMCHVIPRMFSEINKESQADLTYNWFNAETFRKIEKYGRGQARALEITEEI